MGNNNKRKIISNSSSNCNEKKNTGNDVNIDQNEKSDTGTSNDRKKSRKARERANTTHPLHVTTNASNSSIIQTNSSNKTNSNIKQPIYYFIENENKLNTTKKGAILMDEILANHNVIQNVLITYNINVEYLVEIQRYKYIQNLRNNFKSLCKANGNFNPPIYTFERWQARCKLNDTTNSNNGTNTAMVKVNMNMVVDECLPEDRGFVDIAFDSDMIRGNCQEKDAKLINKEMMNCSVEYVRSLGTYRSSLTGGKIDSEMLKHKIIYKPYKHTIDFSCSSNPKQIFKLNNNHYKKLQLLYEQACVSYGKPYQVYEYHVSVYIMLSRYNSILGHGFQMALNETSFKLLYEQLDIQFECFASPLNCTCPHYTSAFPLSDFMFGSVGSFFDFL